MASLRQRIRFCHTPGGIKLAHSTLGAGMPLVVLSGWISHLELDLECPVRRHWYEALATGWSVTRFDTRGFGLSDRDVGAQSLDTIAEDLGAVADNAGLKRFALVALLDGAAAALLYAHRHPERVSHLVLHSGYVRGMLRRESGAQADAVTRALVEQVEEAWNANHVLGREIFVSAKCPEALPAHRERYMAIARESAFGKDALQRLRVLVDIDVAAVAPRVTTPTLVTHARDDIAPPFAEGKRMASLIPEARFVPLEGRSNLIQEHEPAWAQWLAEARHFLRQAGTQGTQLSNLSPRELELALLVARGLDNAQIAARLSISDKTVRNHLTRVFAKLGVGSRAQAIVLARDLGFGETRQ